MTNDPQKENKNNSFNQIRQNIELLRERLNKIEEKIRFQEKTIDLLEISSNCLKNNFYICEAKNPEACLGGLSEPIQSDCKSLYICEAKNPEACLAGVNEVMRRAFSKGKVPKILSKGF